MILDFHVFSGTYQKLRKHSNAVCTLNVNIEEDGEHFIKGAQKVDCYKCVRKKVKILVAEGCQ